MLFEEELLEGIYAICIDCGLIFNVFYRQGSVHGCSFSTCPGALTFERRINTGFVQEAASQNECFLMPLKSHKSNRCVHFQLRIYNRFKQQHGHHWQLFSINVGKTENKLTEILYKTCVDNVLDDTLCIFPKLME